MVDWGCACERDQDPLLPQRGHQTAIVLCHGATDNGLCWTSVARALEENYDVIMPDSRWHGFWDGPAEGDLPDTQVEDLAGFVQALNLEKPS